MDVSDNTANLPAENAEAAAVAGSLWKSIVPALQLVIAVAAVTGIAKALPLILPQAYASVLRTTLATAAVGLAVTLTLRHRRSWVLPSIRMRKLIREVRTNQVPIDEFAKTKFGSLRELGAEVTLLLQDLRQQRKELAELNHEVRQRIANRTDVLERTVSSLRNQAVRDPLTGLFNRRMLDQLLPQLIAQVLGERKSLTLMMIDLDYFKQLNDTLGHAVGDDMLKAVSQIIQSTIRDGDFGFRCGGDEFVLLLPGCDATVSKKVSDRLQSLVSSIGKTYKVSKTPRLSIGISTLAELSEPTAANLMKKADDRLYEIKAKRKEPVQQTPVAAAV